MQTCSISCRFDRCYQSKKPTIDTWGLKGYILMRIYSWNSKVINPPPPQSYRYLITNYLLSKNVDSKKFLVTNFLGDSFIKNVYIVDA